MNAVEEIQSAIDKLTTLKAECTPGRWLVDAEDKCSIYYEDGGATILQPEDWYPRGDNCPAENAELVVTLHRTIDAQLAILYEALDFATTSSAIGMPETEILGYYGTTHEIARAINGGTP